MLIKFTQDLYLILFYHAFHSIADAAGIVGNDEIWLLTKLVPANALVVGQSYLNPGLELAGVRGPVETAFL